MIDIRKASITAILWVSVCIIFCLYIFDILSNFLALISIAATYALLTYVRNDKSRGYFPNVFFPRVSLFVIVVTIIILSLF